MGFVRHGPDATGATEVTAADDARAKAPAAGRGPGRAGWLFGAVTVVPAMLAAAWLLPALPLLLAGRFSARPMVFMFVPLAAGLCYFAVRQLPASWPAFRPEKARTPWWPLAATVAIAVAFTAWQLAERTEQIIYLRDPATYLQVAYWIAHHGYLPIPDSAAAFGGPHLGLDFASSNYYPRGTGIVPQFMTGAPLVLAAGIWLHGIKAALLITPVIGGCAVLSFGGLCLLADSLTVNRGLRKKPDWPGQDKVLAALAGLALGLTVLVRIDGLSDILPAVPFLGVLLAARRRQAVPFGVTLVIGGGYGLADGYLKSRPYLDLEAPSLRPLALIVAATVLATAAGIAITASQKARNTAKRLLATKTAQYLPAAAAVLTVAIFVAFAVRPLVQTVAGETDPTSIAYVAELQKLAGLPVNGRRQYYEDSLYWVIWYLGVPTVLLAAFGLAVLAKRCTKALLTWKDPTAAARIWALPLMMALWSVVTVLYRPAVAPDQPWASRRLVPFVLPGLILGGIWASAWLKDHAAQLGRTRATGIVIASCCAASMLIPTALTTLDLSVTKAGGVRAHGMAFRAIGPGEIAAVSQLCRSIPADASVVIVDSLTADRFAQVVRGMCDVPTAVVADHAALSPVITGIEHVGRRPVLLAENQAELPGTPKEVVNLLTTQEAHNLTAPPTRTWLIHYTIWMSTSTVPSPGLSA